MKTFEEQEAFELVAEAAGNYDLSNTDNSGQIVIYTGVYVWKGVDGKVTFHDEPDPALKLDEEDDRAGDEVTDA